MALIQRATSPRAESYRLDGTPPLLQPDAAAPAQSLKRTSQEFTTPVSKAPALKDAAEMQRRETAGMPAGAQTPAPPSATAATPAREDPLDDAKPINWQKGDLLGSGAFGRVFMGLNVDSGELLAVKQVLLPQGGDRAGERLRELETEVRLMRQLRHPNIVRYLGTARSRDHLCIFLEYVPGGSIAGLLQKFGKFNEKVVRVYTRQLLLGLEFLHAHGCMHRDIKGANLLVDKDGVVKLADFGASKMLEEVVTIESGCKSMKGTPYWMAPEVIRQTGHGRQADIWSVGCTVIEMATGRPPWSHCDSQVSALFAIASAKGPPPVPTGLLSDEGMDFLRLCLNRDPHARPNAPRLLAHPFIAHADGFVAPPAPPMAATNPFAATPSPGPVPPPPAPTPVTLAREAVVVATPLMARDFNRGVGGGSVGGVTKGDDGFMGGDTLGSGGLGNALSWATPPPSLGGGAGTMTGVEAGTGAGGGGGGPRPYSPTRPPPSLPCAAPITPGSTLAALLETPPLPPAATPHDVASPPPLPPCLVVGGESLGRYDRAFTDSLSASLTARGVSPVGRHVRDLSPGGTAPGRDDAGVEGPGAATQAVQWEAELAAELERTRLRRRSRPLEAPAAAACT